MPSPLSTPKDDNIAVHNLFFNTQSSLDSSCEKFSIGLTHVPLAASASNTDVFSKIMQSASETVPPKMSKASMLHENEPKPQVLEMRKYRPARLNLAPTFELASEKFVTTFSSDSAAENLTNLDLLGDHNTRPVFNYYLQHQLRMDPIKIDPSIRLEEQEWFHGLIDRVDAEKLLKDTAVGSYLIRRAEHRQTQLALSLRSLRGFMHFRIIRQRVSGKYTLGTVLEPAFETIPELVNYFTTNRLLCPGAEHMSLLFPLADRLL